jgi:hypothetical protein
MPSLIHVPVDPLTRDLLPRFYAPPTPGGPVALDHPLLRGLYALALDHLPYRQPEFREAPDKKVMIPLVVPAGLARYSLMKKHLARLGLVLDEHVAELTEKFMLGLAIYTSPHHAANFFIRMNGLDDSERTEARLVKMASRAYNRLPQGLLAQLGEYVV